MRQRAAVAIIALVLAAAACGGGEGAKLEPLQELPDDVAGLVDETWMRFSNVLPLAAACMEPVSLVLVDDVPDGDAVYRVSGRGIELQIPTSPARFPESLVHELGHHIAATCGEEELGVVRPEFLAAQGFAPDAPWSAGDEWAAIPAEHFAEAVVEVVLGERILHDDVIRVSPDALDAVLVWGSG